MDTLSSARAWAIFQAKYFSLDVLLGFAVMHVFSLSDIDAFSVSIYLNRVGQERCYEAVLSMQILHI